MANNDERLHLIRTLSRTVADGPERLRVVHKWSITQLKPTFEKQLCKCPQTNEALRGECASRGAASGPVEVSESSPGRSRFRIESDNRRRGCITSFAVATRHRHTGD